MKTIILSDCHIGHPDSDLPLLNRFLMHLDCDQLILAGDFFDLNESSPDQIKQQCPGTLELLRKASNRGIKIQYILGDCDSNYSRNPIMGPIELPVISSAGVSQNLTDGRKAAIIHGSSYQRNPAISYIASMFGISPEDQIQRTAREEYKAFDMLVMGCTHNPGRWKKEDKLIELYNAGDWINHSSYVCIHDDKIHVMHVGSI